MKRKPLPNPSVQFFKTVLFLDYFLEKTSKLRRFCFGKVPNKLRCFSYPSNAMAPSQIVILTFRQKHDFPTVDVRSRPVPSGELQLFDDVLPPQTVSGNQLADTLSSICKLNQEVRCPGNLEVGAPDPDRAYMRIQLLRQRRSCLIAFDLGLRLQVLGIVPGMTGMQADHFAVLLAIKVDVSCLLTNFLHLNASFM